MSKSSNQYTPDLAVNTSPARWHGRVYDALHSNVHNRAWRANGEMLKCSIVWVERERDRNRDARTIIQVLGSARSTRAIEALTADERQPTDSQSDHLFPGVKDIQIFNNGKNALNL